MKSFLEKTITCEARAKINLSLDVVNKLPNGYHEVEMIMQPITLSDTVKISTRPDDEIKVTSDDLRVPLDENNLVYQAAMLMKNHYALKTGFNIHISKKIPIAAGLAGGSSDAAATIRAIASLEGISLHSQQIQEIALSIGADVPFCLQEGAAFAQGIGEKLTPIQGLSENIQIVLVKPNFGVSTQWVYSNLDYRTLEKRPQTKALLHALKTGDTDFVINGLCNVLEEVTLKAHPQIEDIKKTLKSYGADGVLMSGSGPTVFALFKKEKKAKDAYFNIKKRYTQSFWVKPYCKEKKV